jgi:TrmH family RNA methyltransferase
VSTDFLQSRQNPRVQSLARLRERAARDATGRFLVEGERELGRALGRAGTVEEIYFCPEYFRAGRGGDLPGRAEKAGVPLCQLAPAAFDKVSRREGPDGWLGVARAWPHGLEDLGATNLSLVLVAEGVEKPGNLGALLRGADAAGAQAVLVCDPVTDLFNPQVVRNSQGALFSVPVAAADAATILAFLRARGLAVVAATPDVTAPAYWDADLRGPLAVVVGAESAGLSAAWLAAATTRVRIPMAGAADSLNVSVAAALVLFEAARQRR